MQKKVAVIIVLCFGILISFWFGIIVGERFQEKELTEENYNIMYATVLSRSEVNFNGYMESYTISLIEEDYRYYEGNAYSIGTDGGTKIVWRGQEIGAGKLQEGDFVKVTLQPETDFMESFPVSVTPSVLEIEYLGGNNYLE